MGLEIRARRPRPAALAALGLIAVFATACPKKPEPDLDGQPPGQPLALDSWKTDQLYCRAGDCSDWYQVDIPKRGDLRIDVVSPEGVSRNFTVSLASADTEILTRTGSAGSGRAQLFWAVGDGKYLIEVTTTDKQRSALGYEVKASFEPEPEPKHTEPPPPDLVRSEVIEIEGAGSPEAVLIGIGTDHGLRVGQRGRLLSDGEELGRVEVQDVYQEGSRLRIDGALSGPITHSTVAEIEVPHGSLPPDGDDGVGSPGALEGGAPPSEAP